jgi:hypothetical protein
MERSVLGGAGGDGACGVSLAKIGQVSSPAGVAKQIITAMPPGTLVVFYAMDGASAGGETGDETEDATLRIFAIDETGLVATADVATTPSRIAAVVEAYRRALLAGHPSLVRALEYTPSSSPSASRPGATKPGSTASTRREDPAALAARLAAAQVDVIALVAPPPIAARIEHARHLVVVPTLDLGTLPFSALELGRGSKALVETTSVSLASSIFDLAAPPAPWRAEDLASAAVLGNPRFAEPSVDVPPLPGAEREARAIASALGIAPIVGAAADLDAFLYALETQRVVFAATHGVASPVAPVERSLLLFAGDKTNWITPAALTLAFAKQPMAAKLVVLSACQTALGGVHEGGVMGLARAFRLGGAERVVMSQWRVSDAETATLMVAFTRHLRTNFPAEALRLAMLELRTSAPDPAMWAPFVVFGLPG